MKHNYDNYDFERFYADVNGFGYDDYAVSTSRSATFDTYTGSSDYNYYDWN